MAPFGARSTTDSPATPVRSSVARTVKVTVVCDPLVASSTENADSVGAVVSGLLVATWKVVGKPRALSSVSR
jgi:hypothetical protein